MNNVKNHKNLMKISQINTAWPNLNLLIKAKNKI